jgi:hypothetical protein
LRPATGPAKSRFGKHPRWIKMMDDSNVNFFEIEKEFNNFWKGKKLPFEENAILDRENNSERKQRFFNKNGYEFIQSWPAL